MGSQYHTKKDYADESNIIIIIPQDNPPEGNLHPDAEIINPQDDFQTVSW